MISVNTLNTSVVESHTLYAGVDRKWQVGVEHQDSTDGGSISTFDFILFLMITLKLSFDLICLLTVATEHSSYFKC